MEKDLSNQVWSFGCQLRQKGHCKAKIKVDDDDNIVSHTNDHTHPLSQTSCEVVRIKSSIKDRAEETRDSLQQILVPAVSTAPEAASVNLPKLDHLRRTTRF